MAKWCASDSAFSFYPIFGKLADKQDMSQSFLPLFLRQLKLRWLIAALLGSLFLCYYQIDFMPVLVTCKFDKK